MEASVLEISIGNRKKQKSETKRQKLQKQRYRDSDPHLENFTIVCKHNGPTYHCNSIAESDIRAIRNKIFENNVKSEQDIKLCHYMSVVPIERKRLTTEQAIKGRNFSVHYFLSKRVSKKKVQVCQAFFLKCVNIKKDRINYVAKTLSDGNIPKENRGGDHVSTKSVVKKNKIREFIGKLQGKESHYNRKKVRRIYLAADLSIKKLHGMYLTQCDPEHNVNFSMFRRIFVHDFNIGFSTPASDVCAQCTRLKFKIRTEINEVKKREFRTELSIHQKRANAFYSLLKETPENSITFCFDMQQVQPLPKTPINDAFYAQQISMYVFCCVDSQSKHPTFFTWTEDQAGRGSIEIGSALVNYLDSLEYDNITTLRLFCDGCGGQNKNSHIIHSLYFWLRFKAPVQVTEILLVFPVRGHSYLPADRVFGRVEKLLRKKATILSREEYEEIYKQIGVVKKIGTDWRLFNMKELQVGLKKVKALADTKKIVIKKFKNGKFIKIRSFQNYYFTSGLENFEKLLKPKFSDAELTITEKDLTRDWEKLQELDWYRELLNGKSSNEKDEEKEEEETCDCLEEEPTLQI
ncbi:uncharacterized protein [Diabrotica undecimpunctata]|uniref:uncharacterized protein n=1 Tax=Diabrotica undecimpunctata TaxID=50387 RepID=UPI003B6337FB